MSEKTWKSGDRVSWDAERLGRVRDVDGDDVLVEITDGGDDPPAGTTMWIWSHDLIELSDPEPERTDPRGAASTDVRPFAKRPVVVSEKPEDR